MTSISNFNCGEQAPSSSPISSSRSSWYGPSSQAPPTGQLPSLNQDHDASRRLALRGTRSLRFPSTRSAVGDEVLADAIGTPRKSISSRAVTQQGTGDVPDTLREALDIGHFSRGSIDDVRSDMYERAAKSMKNIGSHKPAAKYSQNDNDSLVRSNDNLSGQDPRQVYSNQPPPSDTPRSASLGLLLDPINSSPFVESLHVCSPFYCSEQPCLKKQWRSSFILRSEVAMFLLACFVNHFGPPTCQTSKTLHALTFYAYHRVITTRSRL